MPTSPARDGEQVVARDALGSAPELEIPTPIERAWGALKAEAERSNDHSTTDAIARRTA